MELTEEQKQIVADWVREGASLSDVQKRLKEELGVAMTYMDVRFLVLDLGVEVYDPKAEAKKKALALKSEQDAAEAGTETVGELGALSLDVDRIMKSGCLVSGNVTFSDGVEAAWSLDQMGRLALDASEEGYRPSEEDLKEFQLQLQGALSKRGF